VAQRIYTPGYRGACTHFIFIPPGEYTVSEDVNLTARTLPADLVMYLVSIGNATVPEDDPPPAAAQVDEVQEIDPHPRRARRGQ